MNLDPNLNSGAQGAEALQQAAMVSGAYSLQQIVEAIAKALQVTTDQIKIMVGSGKAYPRAIESPELTAKALDALTNPDSKRSIKIIAEIDGKSEPVFWQTGGKVQVEQDGFKSRFDQALKEPTLQQAPITQAQEPVLEQPQLLETPVKVQAHGLSLEDTVDPARIAEEQWDYGGPEPELSSEEMDRRAAIQQSIQQESLPQTLEPKPHEAPEWLKTAMNPVAPVNEVPISSIAPIDFQSPVMAGPPTIEDPQATNLLDPQEFFKQRIESLQTDLNAAKQQLDSVLGQVQLLSQHVTKMTEDPRVQEWANKANNVFMEKTQGLRTKLKTGAISLATNLYDRARQWAIDSPKIDSAIDSLIQRQGKDSKIELGGLTFSNQDGNRSISKDGQPLYSGGFLSDKIATEDIKTVCRIPDRVEKFCKAFDEFHNKNDMKQQQTQQMQAKQAPTMAMSR